MGDRHLLTELSNELAATVDSIAPSVVQVRGQRRPASGLVYARSVILTTLGAMGGEEDVEVTSHDGRSTKAELVGWDPASIWPKTEHPLGRSIPGQARVQSSCTANAGSRSIPQIPGENNSGYFSKKGPLLQRAKSPMSVVISEHRLPRARRSINPPTDPLCLLQQRAG